MSRLGPFVLSALAWCSQAELTEMERATQFSRDLRAGGFGQVLEFDEETASRLLAEPENADKSGTPVVMMHGMGDYANNPAGMAALNNLLAKEANAYVHSVEICSEKTKLSDCVTEDQNNGFLMPMDKQVDQFARVVQADPKLAKGFHAVGLSQGNLIIRGYIHKYNNPPVRIHLSMHGVMMGVAGLPRCPMNFPGIGLLCKTVDQLASLGVYNPIVQDHIAQTNYFRDPMHLGAYRENAHLLPYINNEVVGKHNTTYKENFESLDKLVLVMAEDDQMIHPKESEWFGYYKDHSQSKLVKMEDAPWYQDNWFGLKTLNEAGKIARHATPGDHLGFTDDFFAQMVRKYFVPDAQLVV